MEKKLRIRRGKYYLRHEIVELRNFLNVYKHLSSERERGLVASKKIEEGKKQQEKRRRKVKKGGSPYRRFISGDPLAHWCRHWSAPDTNQSITTARES